MQTQENKPVALVTGATSGIGLAISRRLATEGYRLIITGRRKERLETLQKELESDGTPVLSLCFDVRKRDEVENSFAQRPKAWQDIDVLINNAGLAAGLEPIQEGNIDDWERMIDTNIKGLLYVTKALAPQLIARRKGHIFNIGSVAGKEVYPGGNVYCATKHAVDALSKAMRIDMLPYGIKITQIAPGAVETEFSLVRFHDDSQRAKQVYNGYLPLSGEDIAACIASVLALPSNVCINDMIITPVAQACSNHIFRC